MADNPPQQKNDMDEVEQWHGHVKNIRPNAHFETSVKAEELPAKQQAVRALEITRQNQALIRDKPTDKPLQPAMPLGSANTVYPSSEQGVTSSQSQTPRFNFETDQSDAEEKPKTKSFIKKLFRR